MNFNANLEPIQQHNFLMKKISDISGFCLIIGILKGGPLAMLHVFAIGIIFNNLIAHFMNPSFQNLNERKIVNFQKKMIIPQFLAVFLYQMGMIKELSMYALLIAINIMTFIISRKYMLFPEQI